VKLLYIAAGFKKKPNGSRNSQSRDGDFAHADSPNTVSSGFAGNFILNKNHLSNALDRIFRV